MLIKLETEPDVEILRIIAENALSLELVNSANAAINILFESIGQPSEITKKFKQKFDRLIKGRLFINLINDRALKTEIKVEVLNYMAGINLAKECMYN